MKWLKSAAIDGYRIGDDGATCVALGWMEELDSHFKCTG